MSANPYAAPTTTSQMAAPASAGGLFRRGNLLYVDRMAQFPAICIKTGTPSSNFVKRKHSWHHPAIAITVLVSPLIYIVIALIVRKKSQFSVAISPEAISRRRKGGLIGSVLAITGVGLFIYGAINSGPGPNSHLAILMLVGALVFIVGVIFAAKFGAYYGIKSIDDRFSVLSGVHDDFLSQVPVFPEVPRR